MRNRTILLVEDNPDDEELTLRALRKSRIADQVVVARDGEEALDYLFGTGAHTGRDLRMMPSVILLDLRLPRIDGLEALRRLRANARTKWLPVVVLTSSRAEQDILRAFGVGSNGYICKPVNSGKFIEAVSQAVFFWVFLNELPRSPA